MTAESRPPIFGPESFMPERRQFALHGLDVPSERFGPLAGFVDIWRGKWRDGVLPSWSDFDFYDFTGWHGWIHVDELVSPEPFDMRCRLWGSELVDRLGFEETGTYLHDSPATSEPNLIAFYRDILERPASGTNVGSVASYQRSSPWSVVKLPCPGRGKELDVILSCSAQFVALDFAGQDVISVGEL